MKHKFQVFAAVFIATIAGGCFESNNSVLGYFNLLLVTFNLYMAGFFNNGETNA